jgi:hypothetical protein
MTTQQQAYIEGFVKRAAQYGYNYFDAMNILKAAELKGDQHKLDVDKDGKIEAEDLKKLRQRKQAADVLTAPGTPDTDIMNRLKGMFSGSGKSKAPAQQPIVGGTAAAAPTINDRILGALGMTPTGIPASPPDAYRGVFSNAPATVSDGTMAAAPVRKPAQMGGAVGVGGTTGTRAPK